MVPATEQLSPVVGTPSVTVVVQLPVASLDVVSFTSAGQVIVGFSSSVMVTFCMQLAVLPLPSVTIQVTLVSPSGNSYVAGLMVTPLTWAMVVATAQLSPVTGTPSVTVVVQLPVASLEVVSFTSAGQVIVGFSSSVMVTFWMQLAVLPLPSVTIQVTLVSPSGNSYVAGFIVTPLTWAMVVATEQLSPVTGTPSVTVVVQLPVASLDVVSFTWAGEVSVGFACCLLVSL